MTELKQNFERDGYVSIKGFLGELQMAELLSQTQGFIKNVVPSLPTEEVYYEDKTVQSTLKQVQKLYDFMQYFNKVPLIGKSTPAHQDGFYFKITPQQALTMWLSLGEADEKNGAVC